MALRFITYGSVDDGKSTLIGRLIYESGNVFDDQWRALKSDSRTYGLQGEAVNFVFLVDGLQAEPELKQSGENPLAHYLAAERTRAIQRT